MKKPLLIIGNKNYSSWSLRAWLLLKAFDVDFNEQSIDLLDTSPISVLKASLPAGKVPVLIQNNSSDSETIRVWDSLAIAIYTNDHLTKTDIWTGNFQSTLKNNDSSLRNNRAYCQSIVAEMHSGFIGIRSDMPMDITARVRIEPSAICLTDLARIEYIFTECLKDKPLNSYLFGHFTVADAFFAPIVLRLQTYAQASGIALKPSTQQYCKTMLDNVHVKAWQQAALQETLEIEKQTAG